MPLPDDAALRALIDLSFDFLCQRRVSEFVDPARVLPALDVALTPERVAAWQTRWGSPMRARLIERARASTITFTEWLPDGVRDMLAEMLGAPVRLPRRMVDELVATEQVRDGVRSMLSDALTGFLKGGEGGGGGIGAAVGWGARAMGAAGRGLLGGLGDGIQKALQERVREFVDGTVATMQKRIADKLASDETARTIGKRRRKGFLGLLAKTEADAGAGLMRVAFDKLDPMLPVVIAHDLAREPLRAAIVEETRWVLDEASKQTIGELFDEMGLRGLAREAFVAHGMPLARALVATPEFATWWERA